MANTGRGSDRSRNGGNGTNESTVVGMPNQKTVTENSVLDRLGVITKGTKNFVGKLSDVAEVFSDVASDYLLNGGLNSMIHDPNALEGIQFLAQMLGYEPLSLFGKNYAYIFDHVRRNYTQGMETVDGTHDWPKFTFYGDLPTVRFADVDNDPLTWGGHWSTLFDTSDTDLGKGSYLVEYSYAESKNYNNEENNSIDKGEMGLGYRRMTQFDFTSLGEMDLIKKTNDLFNAGKMDTLVARFHGRDAHHNNQIESAKTMKFGVSHGRNLLKLSPTKHGDYDNPYCRVWTYYHQYSHINDMIRPFGWKNGEYKYSDLYNTERWWAFRNHTNDEKDKKRTEIIDRFANNTVLNWSNGHVNIAPSAKIADYYAKGSKEDDARVKIKKCMFSIENLAWKKTDFDPTSYDQNGLSPEQKGPFGGRIMWFPPYGINFGEDVQVGWNENEFIGRGENIYTYKNTRRTGRLSFMMLIDHPAILDYWDRKDRSGNSLVPGNQGGVDELHNEEQTLLRFFAGCDMLSAEPQKIPKPKPEPKELAKPTSVTPDPEQVVPEPKGEKTIIVALYYPNNYSGVDGSADKKDVINYLMNGIGAQKGYRFGEFEEGKEVEEEIPISLTAKVLIGSNTEYGGYEMGDKGISIITNKLNENEAKASMKPKPRKIEMLKDEDTTVSYSGGDKYVLTKKIGPNAVGSYVDNKPDAKGHEAIDWYDYRWYTRVDNNTLSQALVKDDSYFDGLSYKYNSTGYQTGAANLGLSVDTENGEKLISFASLFIALQGRETNEDMLRNVFDDKFDQNDVELAKELFDENTTITEVLVFGAASKHSTSKKSDINQVPLAKQRAKTLIGWLREGMKLNMPEEKLDIHVQKEDESNKNDISLLNVDDPKAKAWRSAYVKIKYKNESIAKQEEQNARDGVDLVTEQGDDIGDYKTAYYRDVTDAEYFNNADTYDISTQALNDEVDNSAKQENGKKNKKSKKNRPPTQVNYDYHDSPEYQEALDKWSKDMHMSMQQQIDVMLNGEKKSGPEEPTNEVKEEEKTMNSLRYDNEGEFFEKLTRESPIARHLISEKIKYFDPAFHSISPEGFNARLTFLHQCTRQGPTYANSDTMGENANNLAFGRPPVCILRLGDFYYTKIIINHIGINYDPLTWDLNQEGIGVMPMMAKVDISFNFIGGSDMTGPIARLQNAVSFNYYANASVYDNRAEEVTYGENGKVATFKAFEYGREDYNGKGNTDDNPNLQGKDKKQ